MCGITGWVDRERGLKNQGEIIAKMTDTLRHRGPDGHLWKTARKSATVRERNSRRFSFKNPPFIGRLNSHLFPVFGYRSP
jgi:asparagine synthetase B (glutamine-hydrolysing)